jgi:hypothetical protein
MPRADSLCNFFARNPDRGRVRLPRAFAKVWANGCEVTNGEYASVEPSPASESSQPESSQDAMMLFLASFLALLFRTGRYSISLHRDSNICQKNLSLVASFFGIGLGMILGRSPKTMKRFFGLFAGLLFTLITFAPILRLTHLPVPGHQYEMFGHAAVPSGTWAALWILLGTWIFFAVVPGIHDP